jgi:hypothetical protein
VLLQNAVPMMVGQGGFSMGLMHLERFETDEDEEEAEKPWRLLALEDTGELLSADARERADRACRDF